MDLELTAVALKFVGAAVSAAAVLKFVGFVAAALSDIAPSLV